jgi:cytochrome c5
VPRRHRAGVFRYNSPTVTTPSWSCNVENHSHDKEFVVNFAMVLGGLFVIFFICIVAASLLDDGSTRDTSAALAKLEDRIRPIGQVVTDPAALMKVAAKAPREPLSGEAIVNKICAGCHNAGVLGAYKIGDKAAWGKELAEHGLDHLVDNAIKGINAMPARGGDPDLSDDEVREAVRYMLQQSGLKV